MVDWGWHKRDFNFVIWIQGGEIIALAYMWFNRGFQADVLYNWLMSERNHPIRNLILDMDGVLWHGDRPVPGLQAFFEQLSRSRIGYVLATNNARKVAAQYSEKLAGFGVTVPEEQILTSAEATARHLRGTHPSGARAYVVGDTGLRLAMAINRFTLVEGEGFIGDGATADIVVVGFTLYFCYDDLASATYFINRGASFLGTNPDVTFPTEIRGH